MKFYDPQHKCDVVRELKEKANTLTASMGTGGGNVPIMEEQQSVRRLTPVECERLQGLPDNYTNISVGGKPASDGARYKAIGNGMAQPCADFIIKQIVEWTEVTKE